MATIPPLMRELMTEIARCSRKNMIRFDNDVTSCYDKIVASIGLLVSQTYRMNKLVAVFWGKTLQEAEYKLKTSFKLSETGYKHTQLHPVHTS